MSSTALDQWNGQPPGWTDEPDPEPDFYDWWEDISEADKNEWIAEFVISKSGPLAPFHHWMEVLTNEGAYIDIDAIYVHDDWLARDRHGKLLTCERNGKTLCRVDLSDLCSFKEAGNYYVQFAGDRPWSPDALNRLSAHVIRTYLMDWMEDEDNMRGVWEAL